MIRLHRLAALLTGMACAAAVAAEPARLTIHPGQSAGKIGPLFYGLMTEEINHAYDGGLYAELIQNRIFQDKAEPAHWSAVTGGGATGTVTIDENQPVNANALRRSLRLDFAAGPGQRAGVANEGYWGVPAWPNTTYRASFYARATDGVKGPLTVAIERPDGTALAAATVPAVGVEWKNYDVELTTGEVPVTKDNRFVISASGQGSMWLSLVSLFPPTYHDRPNGNRIDLMQKLADLKPKFLRFPGGNFLEGDKIETRFKWKETLGPLEDRPGHPGCWNYRVTDGLGLLEFLEWCEDLNVEPVLAVYDGYSLKGEHVKPGPDLEPFVQEALQEIEYCQGDAGTEWGARRINDGHPKPFPIHFVEIGNEDWFDRSKTYEGRFAQMFDAIKAKYPAIQCISTMPIKGRRADLQDDHDYPSPRAMLRKVDLYKDYAAKNADGTKPNIFFGEWASRDGSLTPSLQCALADAAWMTGLQRDAETVRMNCYAPLLTRVEKGASQWLTDLIGYDSAASFGSVSYYGQKMFNENLGDVNLVNELVAPAPVADTSAMPKGAVGVGTWLTAAEFKDVRVTRNGTTLYQSDFANRQRADWRTIGAGQWSVDGDVLRQSDPGARGTRIEAGDTDWTDYTLSLKARKTAGDEGFLVYFHTQTRGTYRSFNVGGWQNARTGLERSDDSDKVEFAEAKPQTIEAGRWYDLRVEVSGRTVRGYVDNELVVEAEDTPPPPARTLFTAVSRDAADDVIVKVVNASPLPQPMTVALEGVARLTGDVTVIELSGQPGDVNTIAEPTKVTPKVTTLPTPKPTFERIFAPHSFTILRVKPAA